MSNNNLGYVEGVVYFGDAPNARDMQKVKDNLDRIMKVQEDYFDWKNKQNNN